MATLTVFTPTFNRAKLLCKCYRSLVGQTCKDFVWLVIDDGSTDNTRSVVKAWIDEGLVEIRYHYQENQGMHGAHNAAYKLIDSELNTCLDSDDSLTSDAVEHIIAHWQQYGNDSYSGMVALDIRSDGKLIGTALPRLKSGTLYDLYYRLGVKGDKKLIYRTALTKEFPYPLFANERYVGLQYKYWMLDLQYELLILDKPVCIVDYLPDGSSLNMYQQYRRNPHGFIFTRLYSMAYPRATAVFKFTNAVHYVAESLLVRNRHFLMESPKKFLTAMAIPFGVLLYLFILYKTSGPQSV